MSTTNQVFVNSDIFFFQKDDEKNMFHKEKKSENVSRISTPPTFPEFRHLKNDCVSFGGDIVEDYHDET